MAPHSQPVAPVQSDDDPIEININVTDAYAPEQEPEHARDDARHMAEGMFVEPTELDTAGPDFFDPPPGAIQEAAKAPWPPAATTP